MKRSVIVLAVCTALSGLADTEAVNGISWTYYVRNGEAILGSGYNGGQTAIPKTTTGVVEIPASLGGCDVARIGDGAFAKCGLSTVIIPSSVTSIGANAFDGCKSLAMVSLPSCVESIESQAFINCSSLASLTIANDNIRIGLRAFYGCTRLAVDGYIVVGGQLFEYVGNDKNLSLPSSVKSIGSGAFGNCTFLESVNIPNGVTNIALSAFYNCSNLLEMSIPGSVGEIGNSAFYGCSSMTNVIIEEGVERIEWGAFALCESLTSATIPLSVVEIGSGAFSECAGSLYDKETIPGVRIVDGWIVGSDSDVGESLQINGIRGICNSAFAGKTYLRRVSIEESVARIGMSTFSNCTNLEDVALPHSLESIGYHAFGNCNSLSRVYVPKACAVDDTAFDGCSATLDVIRIGPVVNVVFDSCEGSVQPATATVTNALCYGTLPIPTRYEHVFLGWMLSDKAITSDMIVEATSNHTLYAQWRVNQHALTFDANGGEGGCSETQDYGSALTAPVVSRVGYTFTGWLPAVPATVPASDVTYTAQWRINTHTVTFDANGGTGGRCGTQDYGTAIVAPTVTRTGYDFTGWSPEVAATVPDNDVTYTAQWEAKQYTVTFDANGGVLPAGSDSKLVTYDAAYGALPTPALEFCTFDGWMLGCVIVTPSTKAATAANHTLVANWSRWGARISPSAVSSGQTLRELYPDDYANLTTVVLEEGIAELPVGFFDGCDNVESLTLPESLETLGYDDLPTKIRASLDYGTDGFMVYQGWILGYDNDGASTLTLPQNAIGIGTRAFAEFWDLETVTIPNTVKRIGREAFFECTFLDDVTIPDSVVTVAHGAFENCSYMQTLSVGSGVRKVADRAFARCASLQAVSFAHGLESVGACAFSNDWRMLSVSLPHSVTNIADGAFAACRRVKGVSVPANVLTLSDMFPAAYSNIESVVVASGETDVMADMFNGCFALTDFTWSGSETNVGARAFFGCEALASVAMPDSVVRIGAAAFKGCSSLRDLTLSRSLVALPDFAFEECGALDSFIVPASVMALGEGFVYESAVSAIYYLGNAPEYDANAATNAYANVAENFITYVVRGTRGWDGTPSSRVLPEDWIGHEITYWTPNRFDVTFDANGGYFGEPSVTQWAEEQITDMGYVLPNQNPVRPGYAFEGWWTEAAAGAQVKYSTQVTATRPHTLYAHWRLLGNLITATFNANGGTVVVPGSQNYVSGQTFGEFPVPSRRGYTFCGWWTEASGGERVTEAMSVPAADIELFAHWEPIRYFVAYDANGGTGTMTNQVHVYDAPKALDQNLFSCTGYAFTGWARSADGQVEYADRAEVVNLAEVSNEVVRLYAVWSGAGYNVRFDSNGGTGVMENQTIQIGETQNLHTNAFVFSGREFLGWATESGGTVAYRDGEAVCGLSLANGATVHLYAVWRVADATWRVSFDGNGGSVAPGHWNVARGESLDALPTPTRPGHAFMGWWTQRVGGTSVTPPFAVSSNMTLYAHWRAYDDPLPPVSGDSGVAAVMGDSADLRLGENVKTVDEYNALVEWADENGIGHQAVRTSRHVWASYVLGAESIFENEPEIELRDVAVAAGGGGESGAMMFSVSVTVMDGERAVAVGAAKVAAMFEATSDLADWNGVSKMPVNVYVVDEGGGNGVTAMPMRFQVTTPVGASRAFLRISR